MAKSKNELKTNKNAPRGVARKTYPKTLCNCGRGSVVEYAVPRATKVAQNDSVRSSKEIDSKASDLQDLLRLITDRRGGGGAKVDVDPQGNLVWRKASAEGVSYGGGVGRIGRIDEDKPCCFSEADVQKPWYSRSGDIVINRRHVAY